MSDSDSDNDNPRFQRKGLRYNGFRIPWTFVGVFVILAGNAAVLQYKVQGQDDFQTQVLVRLDEIQRRQSSTTQGQAVLINRMDNLRNVVKWHRTQEHYRNPSGPARYNIRPQQQ